VERGFRKSASPSPGESKSTGAVNIVVLNVERMKARIDFDETWIPQIYFTITPRKQMHGSIEMVLLGVLVRLANEQGIHIKPYLVRGDFKTGNREHLHGVLASDKKINLKLFKRLVAASGLKGRNLEGRAIQPYDPVLGGIIYNVGKHVEVHTFIICPKRKRACWKRGSRSIHDACVHRRRENMRTRKTTEGSS